MWVKKEVLEKQVELLELIVKRIQEIDKHIAKIETQNNGIIEPIVETRDELMVFIGDFKKTVMPVYNLPKKKFKPKDKELYDEEMKENTNYAIG